MLEMNAITLVTGPMRSGTSCITGLLALCGGDLGHTLPVSRNPLPENPRGHFEITLLTTINLRLCLEAGGSGDGLHRHPDWAALDLLALRRARYFRYFIDRFDGDLCKDPLMCLTWPYWLPHWPALRRIVFCLRHPLAVAHSMARRYRLSVAQGLALWQTYTLRCLRPVAAGALEVYIVDFDAFCAAPAHTLAPLLHWLDYPIDEPRMQQHLRAFFGPHYLHGCPAQARHDETPANLKHLHAALRGLAGRAYRVPVPLDPGLSALGA